jgi:hypothetical protein
MAFLEFNIHFQVKETPNVIITKFKSFSTVEISVVGQKIKLFLYSNQQLTNFKNAVLAAYEKPQIVEK